MMPLPYRYLTALMTRFNGSSMLIDCGEGTQIALKEKDGASNLLMLSVLPTITETISAGSLVCFLPWEMQTGPNP